MYHPFSVDGRSLNTPDDWNDFVMRTPSAERNDLPDRLKEDGEVGGLPNFSFTGKGRTLLLWAREHRASWTLLTEM